MVGKVKDASAKQAQPLQTQAETEVGMDVDVVAR